MTNFYKDKEQIVAWLKKYKIKKYILTPHKKYGFVVDIDDDLVISNKKLKNVPVKFNHVTGFFNCSGNELASLEFAPSIVGGSYSCSKNHLTSLKFIPELIEGNFYCYDNKLKSLRYCPKFIKGNFYCNDNLLSSLKHCPEVVLGDFCCMYNSITSLKYIPEIINADFNCHKNKLISLEFSPKTIMGTFNCSNNKLISLEFAPLYVGKDFDCQYNKIDNLDEFKTTFGEKKGIFKTCKPSKDFFVPTKKIKKLEHFYKDEILEIDMPTLRNVLDKIKLYDKLNEDSFNSTSNIRKNEDSSKKIKL